MSEPAAAATFSLKDCSIIFGSIMTGFGEGNAIEFAQKSQDFVSTEGVDGTVLWARTGANLWTIKINLLQSSPSNRDLSAVRLADLETPGGLVLPFTYADKNGADVFFSPKARVVMPPTVTRSNKGESQAWTIEAAECLPFWGGVGAAP